LQISDKNPDNRIAILPEKLAKPPVRDFWLIFPLTEWVLGRGGSGGCFRSRNCWYFYLYL